MADRGILFSAPMVRGLLAKTKTQTRRAIKPQPPEGARYTGIHYASYEPDSHFFNSPSGPFKVRQRIEEGDRLWVREAWATTAAYDDLKPSEMGGEEPIRYDADGHHQTWGYPAIAKIGRKRPGMFMPRWASRLTLIVTEVRVQRLQEISEADASAEGIELVRKTDQWGSHWRNYGADGFDDRSAVYSYRTLWNSLHGHMGKALLAVEPWQANPWVAAYTFTVHKQNIDAAALPVPAQGRG